MKDAKGHGSDAKGGVGGGGWDRDSAREFASRIGTGAHQAGVKAATEGVQGKKLEPGMANAILHDTNSHDRDFHTLRSDQASRLADYAKQFGFRKSATSPGSTARAFHQHLSNRRAREIKASNAKINNYYGTGRAK